MKSGSFCKWLLYSGGILIATIVLAIFIWLFPGYIMAGQEVLAQYISIEQKNPDIWELAMQIGRLDLVSLLLTILAIMLALAAMVGFTYYGLQAKETAAETASEVAKAVATNVAIEQIKGMKERGELEPQPVQRDYERFLAQRRAYARRRRMMEERRRSRDLFDSPREDNREPDEDAD